MDETSDPVAKARLEQLGPVQSEGVVLLKFLGRGVGRCSYVVCPPQRTERSVIPVSIIDLNYWIKLLSSIIEPMAAILDYPI